MVGDRPVVGVRNPFRSVPPSSYLRAKSSGILSRTKINHFPGYPHLIPATKSEPSPAAGGGIPILNEKKH
jgi:hypothetical protein